MHALAQAQGEQRIVLQAESLKKRKWDNRHPKIRSSHSRVMIPSWFSSIMTDTLMCSCWLRKHGKLGSSLAHAPSCPLRTGTNRQGETDRLVIPGMVSEGQLGQIMCSRKIENVKERVTKI